MIPRQNLSSSGVFRSEEMVLCQLFLQSNIAFEATCHFGNLGNFHCTHLFIYCFFVYIFLGIVEFRDLNAEMNAYQRKYVDEIRQIDELERQLSYIFEQLTKENIQIEQPKEELKIPRPKEIIDIENRIEELDLELRNINEKLHSLRLKEFELNEMSQILAKTDQLLETARDQRHNSFSVQDLNQIEEQQFELKMGTGQGNEFKCNKFHTVTGLIRAEKELAFCKLIWRICGQNALVQFFDIETPIDDVRTNEFVQKKVFLIMCQGNRLYSKIIKICDGFHATRYPLPEHDQQYKEMCLQVEKDLHFIRLVIEQTCKQKQKTLMVVARPDHFQTWLIQINKLRAIYMTMNQYQRTEKGFLSECWCAKNDYHLLCSVINNINQTVGIQACVVIVPANTTPPTYFRLNKFTQGFQNIVNSYGMANYREMNPAPYTIITFPFLFAMMFADAGHGFIMMLFALWMVIAEHRLQGKSQNEIWLTFFDGRYIILLMGFFSIYTGLIYNDLFAKSCHFFSSSFVVNNQISGNTSFVYLTKSQWTYPYGIDPAWQLSTNKILFLNSFKMKLSVILGVLQMLFGVMLSLANHINKKSVISILFEFIPQVIFLLSLFGYMIALIFAKWLMEWKTKPAPSILIDFINMFLMKYPDNPDYLRPWFSNKQTIQTILLVLALLQVPIMLLVKPIIIIVGRKKSKSYSVEEGQLSSSENAEHQEEDGSTGDVFIHQAIHTIEYCLGSISHTASYLRLWALSLAHSQLSDVLWTMVMKIGYTSQSNTFSAAIMTYLTFLIWASLTVAILIVMEGLSAFLHALRLHWVEFQSKFYTGAGYAFKPFNLKLLLYHVNKDQ